MEVSPETPNLEHNGIKGT